MAARLLLRNATRPITAGLSNSVAGPRLKHTLPALPYDCKALEPVISGEIMELHHGKHHATYVTNLNVAEEQLKEATEAGVSWDQLTYTGPKKLSLALVSPLGDYTGCKHSKLSEGRVHWLVSTLNSPKGECTGL
jgi:hypothetical protein